MLNPEQWPSWKQVSIISNLVQNSLVPSVTTLTNKVTDLEADVAASTSSNLLQTKIVNRQNYQFDMVATSFPGTTIDWFFPSFTTINTPSNSIIVITFDAPYYVSYNSAGTTDEVMIVKIYDTTGTGELIYQNSQYFDEANGTRSGTLFPLVCSYTPSTATSTKTRTYLFRIENVGFSDTLYLCRIRTTTGGSDLVVVDQFTCKFEEINQSVAQLELLN